MKVPINMYAYQEKMSYHCSGSAFGYVDFKICFLSKESLFIVFKPKSSENYFLLSVEI